MNDLHPIHRLLDVELREVELGTVGAQTLPERAEWLQWTILSYTQLAKLYQPPAVPHHRTRFQAWTPPADRRSCRAD